MLSSTTRPLASWSWRGRVLLRLLNGFVGICYEVLNIQIYQMVIIWYIDQTIKINITASNRVGQAVGRTVYTLMLNQVGLPLATSSISLSGIILNTVYNLMSNQAGGIEADLTITRWEHFSFFVPLFLTPPWQLLAALCPPHWDFNLSWPPFWDF